VCVGTWGLRTADLSHHVHNSHHGCTLYQDTSGLFENQLYNGTQQELKQCLEGKRIILVGDSLTRQQYNAFVCFLEALEVKPAELIYAVCPYLLDVRAKDLSKHTELGLGYLGKNIKRRLCKPLDQVLKRQNETIDLVQLNVGHWTDKAKLAGIGLEWKSVYQYIIHTTLDNLEQQWNDSSMPSNFQSNSGISLFPGRRFQY
jgi:hypothetical protein